MQRFEIKRRITALVMQAVMLTLMLAISSFLFLQNRSDQQNLDRELDNLVSVVNRSIAPALAFSDHQEVGATLASFGQDPRIVSSVVFDNQGERLATYQLDQSQHHSERRSSVRSRVISLYKLIELEGEVLGRIEITVDDTEYRLRKDKLIVSLGLIGLICLVVGMYLSRLLPKALIESVAQLESTFKELSGSDDYQYRATKTKIVELDSLVESFNVMIDRVAQREHEISTHKDNLQMALEGSGEGLWSFNVEDKSWYLDDRTKQLTGFATQSGVRRFLRSIRISEQRNVINVLQEAKASSDKKFEFECAMPDLKGGEHWVMVHGKIYYDDKDRISRISGTILDIDAAKKARQESDLLAAVFQNTREPVVVIDSLLKVLSKNQAYNEYIDGYESSKFLNDIFAVSNVEDFVEEIKESLSSTMSWEGQVEIQLVDEERELKWLTLAKIGGEESDEDRRYLGTFVALDQRRTIEDKLRYYANYDELTELPNRRYFMERLNRAFVTAQKNNSLLGLLFLDMNDFKLVNDQFGHKAGDELLTLVSGKLKKRFSDGRYVVARLGGDEFVVLCEELKSQAEVSAIAESVFKAVEGPHIVVGHEVHASISIGAACFPNDAQTPENLIRNADIAMYEAKLRGRNEYLVFNSEMSAQAAKHGQLKNDLRFAIQRGELSVYLQPKFDLQSLNICSAEALLRWNHPLLGFVSPSEFVPIAEDSGVISELGIWVIEQAIEQLENWSSTCLANLSLSVNVSAKQFSDENLTERIAFLLARHSVSASKLDIEITESLLASSRDVADNFCASIKEIGCSLSIDDFGTGYSSFQYLAELPLDILKIDRDFIRRIDRKEQDQTIINAMIGIASSLGMQVVAEGIETKEQMQYLREKGCEYGQGYWCSKPLPINEFEQFVLTWNRQAAMPEAGNQEAS